jgi:predicted nuclease of predicted toxin-antitoxin system
LTRLKLDENLPVELAELFTAAGHPAETVIGEGLGGKADEEVFSLCQAEGLVLVTLDLSFADIREHPPGTHAGIIVLRYAKQDKNYVMNNVRGFIPRLDKEPPAGEIWIVEETRIRIRGEE